MAGRRQAVASTLVFTNTETIDKRGRVYIACLKLTTYHYNNRVINEECDTTMTPDNVVAQLRYYSKAWEPLCIKKGFYQAKVIKFDQFLKSPQLKSAVDEVKKYSKVQERLNAVTRKKRFRDAVRFDLDM